MSSTPEPASPSRQAVRRPSDGPGAPERGFRPDIQGLRAIAVSLVVVYHLFPSALPGGFAGVDVFFVISGYLITGQLWRTCQQAGRLSLTEFWGRRARRLVPAAALVLAVTWGLSYCVLPASELATTARQIRASALYYQNWQLASDAVNYLQQGAAATPVQHFWTLSVEEQFYLVWPLLFLVALLIARRARDAAHHTTLAHRIATTLTVGVVAASLAYSVHDSSVDPAQAYFVTTTRMWELGAGGLLALLSAPLAERIGRHGWLGWAGLAMLAASQFVLNGLTPYPGWIALLPVGGTLALIAGGSSTARWSPWRLTSARPVVFIGGISYSLYLWHWPLIVCWTAWRGASPGVLAALLLISISVVLAWLTKITIEDRVRLAPFFARHRWRSVSTALAAVVPVTLLTAFLLAQPGPWNGRLEPSYPVAQPGPSNGRAEPGYPVAQPGPSDGRPEPRLEPRWEPSYPGAAALADNLTSLPAVPVLPPPDQAGPPGYWAQGCLATDLAGTVKTCYYGDTEHPTLKIALVGDSMAGNWWAPLDQIAIQRHWELITELRGLCPWTATQIYDSLYNMPDPACHQWGVNVLNDLITTIRPDVVITTELGSTTSLAHPTPSRQASKDVGTGMAPYWRQLQAHGIGVIAIQETPDIGINAPACVSKYGPSSPRCSVPRGEADVLGQPISYAEQAMGWTVPVLSMNSLICEPTRCTAVVGNVLVYFDGHHLTQAYALTLTPYLSTKLMAALAKVLPAAKQAAAAA
jgi:peptidoglycan/LPS O-acetylase OafA/YrhL